MCVLMVPVRVCVCRQVPEWKQGDSAQRAPAPKLERPLLWAPAEASWGAVSALLVGRAGYWVSWETFSFQQLNSRPLPRKLMNSPAWAPSKVLLPLQARLGMGGGTPLGLG